MLVDGAPVTGRANNTNINEVQKVLTQNLRHGYTTVYSSNVGIEEKFIIK